MNSIEIAIASSVPHFVQENDIFGQAFLLEFEWIERERFWMLHLIDSFDKTLVSGLKLFTGWPLYVHHDITNTFVLFLQAKIAGNDLSMRSLSQDFLLVAYEAL
jgi:hypothetical protein